MRLPKHLIVVLATLWLCAFGPLTTNNIVGIGTIATQNSNAVSITGGTLQGVTVSGSTLGGAFSGTIDNSIIGGTTPAAGTFTNLTDNGLSASSPVCTNISSELATCSAGPGTGTVTSVGLSLPGIFTVTGTNPITASGTLTAVLATQTANYVWAGPTSGSAAAPTFRALVEADVGGITGVPISFLQYSTISGISLGNNLDTLTFGTHLAAGGSSYNGSAGVTITSDATSADTASTIVARDGSGNFSAGTITAALTGHASLDLALTGGSISGNITGTGLWEAGIIGAAYGGFGINVSSATGIAGWASGTPTFYNPTGALKNSGGTLSQAAASDLSNGTSGSGAVCLVTSCGLLGTPTAPTAANGINSTQIATTAYTLGNEFISARGSYAVSDYASFGAAVTAASGGGILNLGNNSYGIGSGVTLSSQIIVQGTWPGFWGVLGTNIYPTAANLNLFTLDSNTLLTNVVINMGAQTNTSGEAVTINDPSLNSAGAGITNFWIDTPFNAIAVNGNSDFVDRGYISQIVSGGTGLTIGNQTYNGYTTGARITNLEIQSNNSSPANFGTLVYDCGGCYFQNIDNLYSNQGTVLAPGTNGSNGQYVMWAFWMNSVLGDTTPNQCFIINPTTNKGVVKGNMFIGDWCGDAPTSGTSDTMDIVNNYGGTTDTNVFIGLRAFGNVSSGYVWNIGANTANTQFLDSLICGFNAGAAILIGSSRNAIINDTISQTCAAQSGYTGTVAMALANNPDYLRIIGDDFNGLTVPAATQANYGSHSIIANNIGVDDLTPNNETRYGWLAVGGSRVSSYELSVTTNTQYAGIAVYNGTYTIASLAGQNSGNDNGSLVLSNGGVSAVLLEASGASYINGGTMSWGYSGYANCTALTTSSGLMGCTASDSRLKNDRGLLDPKDALAFAAGENYHYFDFKAPPRAIHKADGSITLEGNIFSDDRKHIGLFADEVVRDYPTIAKWMVRTMVPTELTPDGTFAIDYSETGIIALAAVKQLDQLFAPIPNEIAVLTAENVELKARVAALESRKQ